MTTNQISSNLPIYPPANAPPQPATPLSSRVITMPAVDPDVAKHIIESRVLPAVAKIPVKASLASNVVEGAPSIVELARALKNDPQLIFEFVYNNVDFSVGMGVAKGALGTLLDGYGNPFDQCTLLAALLRQAGFTANYEVGKIQISLAQATAWLGVTDNNINTAQNVFSQAGVPVTIVGGTQLNLSHCWLKVNIGTIAAPNWVVMDPSFKTYTTKTAINLTTATGYSQSTFLTQARSGYTIDGSGNWVQNLNRVNIRSQLATYVSNLVSWIRANNPTATLDDVLGGRQIVPVTLPITFPATLSYEAVGDIPTEFTGDFTNAYKVTIEVIFPGIDITLTSDQVYGHRLTWFYTPAGVNTFTPVLALDGVTLATGSVLGGGTNNSIKFIVNHNAYPTTGSNQTFFQSVFAPNQSGFTGNQYYLIGTSFGPAGKGSFDYHTALQRQYEFNAGGASATLVAEAPLGERMAAQFASDAAQATRVSDMLNRMTGTLFFNHHTIGTASYQVYGTPTFSAFDIQGVVGSGAVLNSAVTNYAAAGINNAMHGYALEMLTLQQLTGQLGASTTRILDVANSAGTKIWKGTFANWNATVSPSLTGYNPSDLTNIYNNFLTFGWDVVLPQSAGQSFNGHWTLTGWSLINPPGGAEGIIFSTYAGGIVSGWWPGDEPKKKKKKCEEKDPVLIQTGDYHYRHNDITVGSGFYPYSLSFKTSYDSRARLATGPLGLGWTHNWATSVQASSDGFLGLGSESPISAAASIVDMFVTLDILSDTTLPVDKLVMVSLSHQWWVDQLTNNTVTVSLPDNRDLTFVLLPDGSYNPPQGDASSLTLLAGAYTHTTLQKVVSTFNTAGQLLSIAFPNGATINLSYTAGKLFSITNNMGRTLTLGYTGAFITSVSDGTGRSVGYTIDGSNQLSKFTDALSQAYTFVYDTPGRMQKYFMPQNPTNACVSNTYDSLNRISSQLDIMGHTISFYLAGTRSEILDPLGNKSIVYYDANDNEIKTVDALGNNTVRQFDGLGRATQVVFSEGNSLLWTYDSNNNTLTTTKVPKPGSTLPNIVLTNTYDPLWNKIQTAKDGNLNTTTYTYDPLTGNLLQIQQPAVTGGTPTVLMTWNGRGQMLTRTDASGVVTKFTYDTATEKLTSAILDSGIGSHLNLTTNIGCDTVGNVTSIQDPLGNTIGFLFDNLRRVTQQTDPTPFNYQTRCTYDANGNPLTIQKQTGIAATPWQTSTWAYTLSDKKSTLTDPAGNVTAWFYDSADRLQKTQDAENRVYQYGYDQLNRVSTVTDPTLVVSETRGYSPNGKLSSIMDASGNTTTFTFDGFDRPDKTIYPGTPTTYEQNLLYDANGNVKTYVTRLGTTIGEIISTFDALNRPITKAPFGQPTESYSYDLAGRLLSITDSTLGVFQRNYDSAGRFYQEIYPLPDLKTVTFTLDANNNATRIVYPDGYYVDRAYDQLNRLTTIKLNGATAPSATFGYDQLSRRTSLVFGSEASATYGYGPNDDLIELVNSFAGSSVSSLYDFNKVHEIKGQKISDGAYSWQPAVSFSSSYMAANNLNQYPKIDSSNYTYNSNGCLTGDSVWTHTFDTENHLLSSAKTGISLAFVNDPFHRQVQKSVTTTGTVITNFVYSGWQRIVDYVGSVLQNRYIYGSHLDEPLIQVDATGKLTFLHSNHLGSIIAISDNSGVEANKNTYGPFGETSTTGRTSFGFNGQRYDSETGLYYYKRRYYSPVIGRFLQPDPIGYDVKTAENCACACAQSCGGAEPSALNLYSYAGNSPLSFIDPLGLAPAAPPATTSASTTTTVTTSTSKLGSLTAIRNLGLLGGILLGIREILRYLAYLRELERVRKLRETELFNCDIVYQMSMMAIEPLKECHPEEWAAFAKQFKDELKICTDNAWANFPDPVYDPGDIFPEDPSNPILEA